MYIALLAHRKLKSHSNQHLITACHQLWCRFLVFLINHVVLVALGGRADWGSRGLRPHSCFSHSHFSKTVDFISCRPRPGTLFSAFSLLLVFYSFYFFLTCSLWVFVSLCVYLAVSIFLTFTHCCFYFSFLRSSPCYDLMLLTHLNFPNPPCPPEQNTKTEYKVEIDETLSP